MTVYRCGRYPALAQKLLLLFSSLGVSVSAHCEEAAGARSKRPALALSYTRLPSADFADAASASAADGRESRLSADLFRHGNGNTRFLLGFDYQYTRFTYEGIAGRDRDLHRLQVPLRYESSIGQWQVAAQVAPGVSTSSNVMRDLVNEIQSDDVIVTAGIEASRPTSTAGFRWLAGLRADRAFGKPKLYPVAGVLYSPTPETEFRLAFPDSELRYSHSDRQRISARLFPAGHEWHVLSEELNDEFSYRIRALRLQATWSFALWRSVWIDLAAGYETGRHHEFVDDTRQSISADLDDEILLSIGFRLGDAPLPYTNDALHYR